jgi:GxxExxY protein
MRKSRASKRGFARASKSVHQIVAEHRAQVFNYLRATGYRLGLLVNFGYYPQVEYERIVV